MENISIRKATMDDVAQLCSISRQTFTDAYAARNTEENISKYMQESFSTEKLNEELNNRDSAFYFAILNDEVIGYIKLNTGPAQTDIKDGNGLEIERIYVLQQYQSKKVGQLLYEHAVAIGKQKAAGYLWLGVWEQNHKAINFYERVGLAEFDRHKFMLGDDEQIDIMMKLQLH